MKTMKNFFALGLILSLATALPMSAGVYKQELEALKEKRRVAFNDRDSFTNQSLGNIQRHIESYKELGLGSRILRSMFFLLGGSVVTSKSMPKLYGYINAMCKEQGIATPTIFVTKGKGLLNSDIADLSSREGSFINKGDKVAPAFYNSSVGVVSSKLLMSTGAIVIGRDLLFESSDEELEATIARQVAHIKYNHVNKRLALSIASYFGIKMLFKGEFVSPFAASFLLDRLIIGKSFEREADEFAYKVMGKGEGIIKSLENLQQKEKQQNADFDDTYALMQDNRDKISFFDYYIGVPFIQSGLAPHYYVTKMGYNISKVFKWLTLNTPLGDYPTHEERIKTARDYLATQAA